MCVRKGKHMRVVVTSGEGNEYRIPLLYDEIAGS